MSPEIMSIMVFSYQQAVLCALPECAPGVGTATPPGQCCPQCGECVMYWIIIVASSVIQFTQPLFEIGHPSIKSSVMPL